MIASVIPLALMCLLIVGCSRTVKPAKADLGDYMTIGIESFSNEDVPISGRRVYIQPGRNGDGQQDAEYVKYEKMLRVALKGYKYEIVQRIEDADVIVVCSFGSGEPRENVEVHRVPMLTMVGGRTTTTSVVGPGGVASITSQTNPTMQVNSQLVERRTTTFLHYLYLYGYAAAPLRESKQLLNRWKIKAVYAGRRPDLDDVAGAFVVLSIPRIDKVSTGIAQFTLPELDPRIIDVRQARREPCNDNPLATGIFRQYKGAVIAPATHDVQDDDVEGWISDQLKEMGIQKASPEDQRVLRVQYATGDRRFSIAVGDEMRGKLVFSDYTGSVSRAGAKAVLRYIAENTTVYANVDPGRIGNLNRE